MKTSKPIPIYIFLLLRDKEISPLHLKLNKWVIQTRGNVEQWRHYHYPSHAHHAFKYKYINANLLLSEVCMGGKHQVGWNGGGTQNADLPLNCGHRGCLHFKELDGLGAPGFIFRVPWENLLPLFTKVRIKLTILFEWHCKKCLLNIFVQSIFAQVCVCFQFKFHSTNLLSVFRLWFCYVELLSGFYFTLQVDFHFDFNFPSAFILFMLS